MSRFSSPLARTSVMAPPGSKGLVNVAKHMDIGRALIFPLQMVKLNDKPSVSGSEEAYAEGVQVAE